MKQESLDEIIEQARQELCKLEQLHGISHPSVLQQSMVLDELINQYNRNYYTQVRHRPLTSNGLVAELPGHSQIHSEAYTVSFG